ncbi:DUF362 domain-containing protein [Candidatus Saccharibacteria bacterium]|nr:DUF362 domain-containing protein [Candidatus Saccharibacteria bacterium]
MSKVYFTKEITANGLQKAYNALSINLQDKIGVQISVGDRNSTTYLKADLVGPLVKTLGGTFIASGTAHDGDCASPKSHRRVAREHGFTKYADIDIMDAHSEFSIPIDGVKHLEQTIVGDTFNNYSSIINIACAKRHSIAGFGASIKNQAIDLASRHGKAYIYTAGKTSDPDHILADIPEQSDFIESIAEGALGISNYLKTNHRQIIHITVVEVIARLGILASLDPVASDQALIDLIWTSKIPNLAKIQKHINLCSGLDLLPYAESIGLGSREYELVEIK